MQKFTTWNFILEETNIVDYATAWLDKSGDGDIKSDRVTNFQVQATEFTFELWKLPAYS